MALTSEQRVKAIHSAMDHFEKTLPKNRDDLLDVLGHIMAAALIGKSPTFVVGYMTNITRMLDGKFTL